MKQVNNNKELGAYLRQVRTKQHIFFREILEETGMSTRTIQNIEQGAPTKLDSVFKFAKTIGVQIYCDHETK